MKLNRILNFWSFILTKKNVSPETQKKLKELKVKIIKANYNEDMANNTKLEAQKILSIMFASLHKRGRPKKENEELQHAV